jgi:hypothetical protein
MSSIRIMRVSLPSKNLLFILNNESSDSMARTAWNHLESKTQAMTLLELQNVDLFNALRASFDEDGIPYSPHGEIPQEYLIRVEGKTDIGKTVGILKTVAGYAQIENGNSSRTRTPVEYEGLAAYKERLRELAKKYAE